MDDHNPDACFLAHQLTKDFFGDIVAHVSRKLLEKGPMSLSQIVAASSQLPLAMVQSSLLILIQHNIVRTFKTEVMVGGIAKEAFMYEGLFDRTLQNLRKPWILLYSKTELGDKAELVVEALLENGRLQYRQILSNVAAKMKRNLAEVEEDIKITFFYLVNNHYIERCPPCGLPGRLVSTATPTVKKKGRKPGKKGKKEASSFQIEIAQRDCANYEKERFKLPLYLVLEDPILGEKRKEPELGDEEKSVLWRVNFDHFNQCYRHQTCVHLVANKIGRDAAFALKCILDVAKLSDAKVQSSISFNFPSASSQGSEDVSRPVSMEEITKAMEERLSKTDEMPPDDLEDALTALKDDQLELVTYMGEQSQGSVFCVNLTRIIECCQLVHLETSIRDRFGIKGLRIFRLLLFKKQLEQKQIADLTMLDPKEARSLLYDLFKAGYVIIQDIPRSTDHAASRTFFTWKVVLQDAVSHFRRDLYRASRNVHSRLISELQRGNELLALLELSQRCREAVHITEKQRNQTGKLSNVLRVLEMSLMNLDDVLGIMNNFSC